MSMQGLALLGSTGSIGESALEVVRQHPDRLSVVALAAHGRRIERLIEQIAEFSPAAVAVADPAAAERLVPEVPSSVRVESGTDAVGRLVERDDVDRVVAAMVGAAGLPPVHRALALGKDVALANKESMVVAGPVLNKLAAQTGARILPVDSEHAALHQALRGGAATEVRRLILTASGGPFRNRPEETWSAITPEEALKHPTWQMGAKISVDSATLMNKGLELIEANRLFDVPAQRIDVLVHPQSIVHSFVEFCDGTWLGQLSHNSMVFPIQYALSYPERWGNTFPRLSVEELSRLDFEELDGGRFRAVALARGALEAGESAPAVFNAANEEAVAAFLARKISFPSIVSTVEAVLEDHHAVAVENLEEALHWDDWGRRRALQALAKTPVR